MARVGDAHAAVGARGWRAGDGGAGADHLRELLIIIDERTVLHDQFCVGGHDRLEHLEHVARAVEEPLLVGRHLEQVFLRVDARERLDSGARRVNVLDLASELTVDVAALGKASGKVGGAEGGGGRGRGRGLRGRQDGTRRVLRRRREREAAEQEHRKR